MSTSEAIFFCEKYLTTKLATKTTIYAFTDVMRRRIS